MPSSAGRATTNRQLALAPSSPHAAMEARLQSRRFLRTSRAVVVFLAAVIFIINFGLALGDVPSTILLETLISSTASSESVQAELNVVSTGLVHFPVHPRGAGGAAVRRPGRPLGPQARPRPGSGGHGALQRLVRRRGLVMAARTLLRPRPVGELHPAASRRRVQRGRGHGLCYDHRLVDRDK